MSADTHDFTRTRWGHDIAVLSLSDDGKRASLAGWSTPHPKIDDFLLLPAGEGRSTRYRLTHVRAARAPHDMWFGDAVFAPRQEVTK